MDCMAFPILLIVLDTNGVCRTVAASSVTQERLPLYLAETDSSGYDDTQMRQVRDGHLA